ncbi:UNVERIFIED_CONTAM: hypothetical protein OHV15_02410 [Microbacterium sp. SLM126]
MLTTEPLAPTDSAAPPDDVDPAGAHQRPPRERRRRKGHLAVLVVSVLLISAGIALLGGVMIAPDAVEKVVGNTEVAVRKAVHEIVAPGTLPEITLGPEGGVREMDHCDGTFTEMISYRMDEVLPLYAAHHRCGGDIILGWEMGERVRVAGSDVIYEVVEERHTPKWSQVDALKGMTGEFMVQTCYYGENRMRFLALAPAADQTAP